MVLHLVIRYIMQNSKCTILNTSALSLSLFARAFCESCKFLSDFLSHAVGSAPFTCIFSLLCVYYFYHLPLYPAVQLDVLAVVVDVVAGVVDVQRHVLVLEVLLQPALVRLTTPQLLIHLQKHLADQHLLQDK